MKNSFAVVCEWPGVNAAENETIFRIKIAADKIKKTVLVIDKYGNILDENFKPTLRIIKNQDVDFIINLHFASPKCYDGFSYVALWNPIKFYHDWGYKKYSYNLTSHHDFISCLSEPANDHAFRISYINNTKHLEPKMVLNHTNSGPYYQFDDSRNGVFYCGINWDRSSGKSRFSEIFETLDKRNILKIYGPRKLGKIIPWVGFKSYVDEIPFDGVSTFKEISKCLLGLALSHDAHIESAIASSRVFELIAGGALPICDENPFFRKYFGDKVLYVNGGDKEKAEQIANHYSWALQNKNQVQQMVNVLQNCMKENFDLSKQLEVLCAGHQSRKELVEKQYCALENKLKVNVIYIHNDLDNEGIEDDFYNLTTSIKNQNYQNISVIIASNQKDLIHIKSLDDHGIGYQIIKHDVAECSKIGLILEEVKNQLPHSDNALFLVTSGCENFFYDHISSLVRCFEDDNNCQVAESNCVLFSREDDYGPYINNNSKEFYILDDHNFVLGSSMFRNFPSGFVLRYLDCRNYCQSLKSFFGNFYIKLNKATIKFDIKKNLLTNKSSDTLSASLLIDYAPISQSSFGGLAFSKDTAYQILSHIKFFSPIIKIRNFMKKQRIKRRSRK